MKKDPSNPLKFLAAKREDPNAEPSTSTKALEAARASQASLNSAHLQDAHLKKDCPICADFLLEPVLMKRCGHYFCLECLNEVARYALKDHGLMPVKDKEGRVFCPLCREVSSEG